MFNTIDLNKRTWDFLPHVYYSAQLTVDEYNKVMKKVLETAEYEFLALAIGLENQAIRKDTHTQEFINNRVAKRITKSKEMRRKLQEIVTVVIGERTESDQAMVGMIEASIEPGT